MNILRMLRNEHETTERRLSKQWNASKAKVKCNAELKELLNSHKQVGSVLLLKTNVFPRGANIFGVIVVPDDEEPSPCLLDQEANYKRAMHLIHRCAV